MRLIEPQMWALKLVAVLGTEVYGWHDLRELDD
jgi:hypothetical protein